MILTLIHDRPDDSYIPVIVVLVIVAGAIVSTALAWFGPTWIRSLRLQYIAGLFAFSLMIVLGYAAWSTYSSRGHLNLSDAFFVLFLVGFTYALLGAMYARGVAGRPCQFLTTEKEFDGLFMRGLADSYLVRTKDSVLFLPSNSVKQVSCLRSSKKDNKAMQGGDIISPSAIGWALGASL